VVTSEGLVLNHWGAKPSSIFKSAVAHQISLKSGDFSLRYHDLTTFQAGAQADRHIKFLKFGACHVTSITMLFCFSMQNLTEIGRSAA